MSRPRVGLHMKMCGSAINWLSGDLVIPLMAKALLSPNYAVLYLPGVIWCYWHNAHSLTMIPDWIYWPVERLREVYLILWAAPSPSRGYNHGNCHSRRTSSLHRDSTTPDTCTVEFFFIPHGQRNQWSLRLLYALFGFRHFESTRF